MTPAPVADRVAREVRLRQEIAHYLMLRAIPWQRTYGQAGWLSHSLRLDREEAILWYLREAVASLVGRTADVGGPTDRVELLGFGFGFPQWGSGLQRFIGGDEAYSAELLRFENGELFEDEMHPDLRPLPYEDSDGDEMPPLVSTRYARVTRPAEVCEQLYLSLQPPRVA